MGLIWRGWRKGWQNLFVSMQGWHKCLDKHCSSHSRCFMFFSRAFWCRSPPHKEANRSLRKTKKTDWVYSYWMTAMLRNNTGERVGLKIWSATNKPSYLSKSNASLRGKSSAFTDICFITWTILESACNKFSSVSQSRQLSAESWKEAELYN